jgi:integrase
MLQIGLGQDLNNYPVLRKNLAKFKKMSPPEKKAKEYEYDEWQRIEQLQGSDKVDEIELLIDRCVSSLGVFGGIRGRSSEQVCHEWFTGLDVAEKEQGELEVKIPQHLKNLGPDKHDFIIPAQHAKPFFALRKECPFHTGRFFRVYVKRYNKWTKNRFIGKNTLAEAGIRLATRLGLPNPELHTGHCWRRTGTTILAEAGASEETIMAYGKWSSRTVPRKYISTSKRHKRMIAAMISNGTQEEQAPSKKPKPSCPVVPMPTTSNQATAPDLSTTQLSVSNMTSNLPLQLQGVTFNNCNVTFNLK